MKKIIFSMGICFGCGFVALYSDRPGHVAISGVCFATLIALSYTLCDREKVKNVVHPDAISIGRLSGIDLSKLTVIAQDEEKIVYEWHGHEITSVLSEPGKLYWRVVKT